MMGQTLLFDIETDGLIPELTVIHSLVIKDFDTGLVMSCHDHGGPYSIQLGLKMLSDADTIVGHNIQEFDVPAIQKLYPWFKPKRIRDTIIMSRLMWPDMKDADFRQAKKRKWIEQAMFGRHSLKSWGQRLGIWKGDYGEIMETAGKAKGLKGPELTAFVWGQWSQGMQDYCEQDVEVTETLYRRCIGKGFSEDSIQLEHDVRRIVSRQEAYGFAFDTDKAHQLYGTLAQAKVDLEKELEVTFKPWFRNKGRRETTVDRKVSQKHLPIIGYEKDRKGNFKLDKEGERKPIWVKATYATATSNEQFDGQYTDVKLVPFNPGSRFDIEDRLTKLFGWKPTAFGKDGTATVDEETLKGLPWPEAKLLRTYLMVQKRLGQVSEGKEGWLRHVRNGRIHGAINTMGAATSRMTHSKPNVAQVPGLVDKKTGEPMPYGRECRELFGVTTNAGKILVGCDADALELRDLAGYMAIYDGGAYIETVLRGNKANGTDMHTINAKALGCSRDVAKVWFYAFIYGSGDENLGNILGIMGKQAATAAGKKSRAAFLAALPALMKLIENVKKRAAERGYLKGLDGRLIPVRKQHSALNTLLQSAGAIQMKRALVILDDALQAQGFVPGVNYEFVANVHDEWQIEADEDKAELVGKTAEDAIRLAGEYYKFRCPLAGNAGMGANWASTH